MTTEPADLYAPIFRVVDKRVLAVAVALMRAERPEGPHEPWLWQREAEVAVAALDAYDREATP